MILALLCAFAQGAWAQTQNEWDEVYALTQTTSANWTPLNAGSATGQTLGSAGATSYYYITGDLNFANSNAGGSGLKIQGMVFLYIPSGVTVTCTGHNASAPTGAGAGIELAAGNTLYLIGGGTLNATGGNAANGGNGSNGTNAGKDEITGVWPGNGGRGGDGGGGAGAGIGTRGANGGAGGAGGSTSTVDWNNHDGVAGSSGSDGGTAAAMGSLYVFQALAPTVNANGGSAGTSGGTGGSAGNNYLKDGSNNYSMAGGGGGGCGGHGGEANNIGSGGRGGGGGGGGACGSVRWAGYDYFRVGAYGGNPGANANEPYFNTTTGYGGSTEMTGSQTANDSGDKLSDRGYEDNHDNRAAGGGGGDRGNAGSSGSAIDLPVWPTSGTGTEAAPYLIGNANEWYTFITNVINGNSYSGKYIQLTANISVTALAGFYHSDNDYHPFSGTFDGDGHTLTLNVSNQSRFAAPFKCVSGATIKNLRTAGTIDGTGNADGKLLAGIIGVSFGNTTITGCRSSVTLTTDFGEDAAMAGLVAGTKGGSLTIEGCVFDGSMTGSSNTRCAGIAGYEYTATTTTISNCLFIPATLTISTSDDGYTKTFSRDGDATVTNCYYTQTLGAAQGNVPTISAQVPSAIGSLLQDYGVVKAYQNGILFGGNYYYDANPITCATTTLSTGTYTVHSDVEVPSRITISGSVTINLEGGTTLHAPKGIEVSHASGDNTLTINGPGALTIDNCDNHKSGIGASSVGYITINGGTINVNAGSGSAAIGGDWHNIAGGNITINGGVVNATGQTGIGGGAGRGSNSDPIEWGACGDIIINGGQVTAIGRSDGAGIGPGDNFQGSGSGTLYLSWTNQLEDFVYCSSFYSDRPGSPSRVPISNIYLADNDKKFIIEGTSTIPTATADFRDNAAGRRLLPYIAGQTPLPGAGTQGDPYRISSTADWNMFAHNVMDGNSYSGQFVRLDADIDITREVGYNDTKPFSGTFLGNNHTITATITSYYQGAAPFNCISGATIKNLTVAGTITTNQRHSSALVGFAYGTNLIEGCTVTATINTSTDYTGGFLGLGLTSATTIKDCIFAGAINGVGGGCPNVGVFWGWSDSATPTLQNCLEKGTYTNVASMHPIGLQGGSGTITNCYYLNPQKGSPSNACTVSGAYRVYADTPVNEIYHGLTAVDGNNYYIACPVSGIAETYDLTQGISITPVVTDHANTLVLGTHYTATLNGESVVSFPIIISTEGEYTLVLTGQGSYTGSNSIGIVVFGSPLAGEGTAESPYLIGSNVDWCMFANNVNSGTDNYSGKYVQLTADISVSVMVGESEEHSFRGIFDGDGHTLTFNKGTADNPFTERYCAPFRHVRSATIKNLYVTGDIYTSNQYAAGVVAQPYGNAFNTYHTYIINCRASTVIHSSYFGDGTHGGIAALPCHKLHITGCVYNGRMFTTGGTTGWGGIVGWGQSPGNAYVEVNNTLYAPNTNITPAAGETAVNSGATIVRGFQAGDMNGCYYTETLGSAQGAKPYSITPGEYVTINAGTVNNTYNVSGLTFYNVGFEYDGVLYATQDSAVSLTLGGNRPNYYPTGYTASAGTLTGTQNPYTLTMPNGNVTISATGWAEFTLSGSGTAGDPYLISSESDWNNFASYVNNGNSLSGQFVRLDADISVSMMVGTSGPNSFQGTFLGDNHTLTFTQGSSGSAFNEQYCAPFRYTNGATIRNLKTAGDIYTSQKFAAGLVAHPYGTTTITNCHVSTVIHSTINGDGTHGGFVAHPDGNDAIVNISGCVYDGRLLTNNGTNSCGGFVGWHSAKTINVSNSLYVPSGSIPSGWTAITNGATFVHGNNSATDATCYFTEIMSTAQGTHAIANATAPANLGSLVQDYGMVTAYENSLLVDGTYYVAYNPSGTGAENDPYIISNNDDWLTFAAYVNGGNNFSGKFVKLTADISVSEMAGTSETNSFQGTFLGNGHTLTFTKGTSGSAFNEQYCAPFRYVNGATIRDLKTAGGIYTSKKFAAGLIAHSYGTTTITDCYVGIYIYSRYSFAGTHGGIVAMPEGNVTITGCAYTGRLLTNNGTNSCGGFVGNQNGKTITVTNSLYAPGRITFTWSAINDGATFVRGGSPTIDNCYYTSTLGTAQGMEAVAFATAPANLGSLVENYGMVTAYENGILVDGTYYVGYYPSGTGTAGDPYTISNSDDWNTFASHVNNGNNHSGKYVKLTADIDITTPAGSHASDSDNKPFSGTFLGDGHTITVTLDDDGNQGLALFRYINGATIKDLKVAGTIASSQYHTSGLVGFADGINLIENCIVTATLDISSDFAGGIVGHGRTSTTTIRGCAFAGTINGVDGNRSNIGGLWGWSTSGTPALENCLEAGTYTNIASMHPMGLQGGSGTITNCYYVNPQVGSPSNACTVSGASQTYSITPGDYVTVANAGADSYEYSVSGLTFYTAGLQYNDMLYAASGDAVSLNLNSSASSAEQHASA